MLKTFKQVAGVAFQTTCIFARVCLVCVCSVCVCVCVYNCVYTYGCICVCACECVCAVECVCVCVGRALCKLAAQAYCFLTLATQTHYKAKTTQSPQLALQ